MFSLANDIRSFAVELRKLAYTMPGGYEDRLINLSERMIRRAEEARSTAYTKPDYAIRP